MHDLSPLARRLVAFLVAFGVPALPALAQSAQPWSVQASVLLDNQKIGSTTISGAGFEGMLRYTPSAFSIGVGYQYSTHSSAGATFNVSGVFLEPRYAIDIGSDRLAPYLAGRVAFLSESSHLLVSGQFHDYKSSGTGFGGGLGLLIRASKTVNIDLGAAIVQQTFQDATTVNGPGISFKGFAGYVAKGGISLGFGGK